MRDPDRIDRILHQLEAAWYECPDMRLGQLLLNVTRAESTSGLWSVEDARMEKMLDRFLQTHTGNDARPDA